MTDVHPLLTLVVVVGCPEDSPTDYTPIRVLVSSVVVGSPLAATWVQHVNMFKSETRWQASPAPAPSVVRAVADAIFLPSHHIRFILCLHVESVCISLW